jgi:high-affinity K+ transport system ATPase subunit B
MASTNPNMFKRLYENVMGTPEQNKAAAESMKRAEENNKAKKAKEEEEQKKKKTTNMAKGGAVAKKKTSAVPAKGRVVKAGSKAAKTGKTPLLVIALKPKMAKGGCVTAKKKGK